MELPGIAELPPDPTRIRTILWDNKGGPGEEMLSSFDMAPFTHLQQITLNPAP